MPIGVGTNLDVKTGNVNVSLTNSDGNATRVSCTTSNIPSGAAGYAVGCTLQNSTTGILYTNLGTTTSCTFTKVSDVGDIPLTSAHIVVGNSSNVGADVAMTGDTTIDNTGAVTIGAAKVTGAKMVTGTGYFVVEATANATTNVNVFGSTNGFAGTITGAYAVTAGTVSSTITITNAGSTVGTIATGATVGLMAGMTSVSNGTFTSAGTMVLASTKFADTSRVFITFTVA